MQKGGICPVGQIQIYYKNNPTLYVKHLPCCSSGNYFNIYRTGGVDVWQACWVMDAGRETSLPSLATCHGRWTHVQRDMCWGWAILQCVSTFQTGSLAQCHLHATSLIK